MQKDVLVLVATKFEDTELISTINVFSRNNITYDLVSIENKDIVQGQNKALVATKKLVDINVASYRSIFLPGGEGHKLILTNEAALNVIKMFKNKFMFAICAAPAILLKLNLINGIFTSYPGFASDLQNTGKELEVLDKIITAKDYKVTIKFAEAIVKKLK